MLEAMLKSLALALLVSALASPLGAVEAPAPVRTHYEVTIQQGRSTWTVGSAANVASGVPIKHDLGPYRLSLVPRLGPAGHYTLAVSVGLIPHGPGAVFAPESRTFDGNMEFPLEFTTTMVGTTVKGAIMVAHVRKPAAGLPARP